MTEDVFYKALEERHGKENQEKLKRGVVGIAGLGGLGSNVAYSLARLGVGKLILVDFDRVDITNLNRQQYFAEDLGSYKTEALARGLIRVNPFGQYLTRTERVTPENVKSLFGKCHILVEAFDRPEEKAMLVEQALVQLPGIPLITGSGMAGYGSANEIHTRKTMGRVYICGDGVSDLSEGLELMAPRVAVCAAHEATMVLRILLGEMEP